MALVLVPVALMLGSVYAHAAAARLSGEAERLAGEKAAAEVEAERLQVLLEERSGPVRVREAAKKDLGMLDPSGADLKGYEGGEKDDGSKEGGSGG